jgi:hypothetical protein
MSSTIGKDLRWEYYLIHRNAVFSEFWKGHLSEKDRNVLFVLGLGFDPRTCSGLRAVLDAGGEGDRECLLIEYDEGSSSPSREHTDLVEKNRQLVSDLLQDRGTIKSHPLQMWSPDGRRIGARVASNLFRDCSGLEKYSDIIVDIGAMPRGIYFPIITKLLYLMDSSGGRNGGRLPANLHVIVAEDVRLDTRIREEGIDENASYLHGFSSDLEREASANIPKVWIPVLGEGKEAQLIRIYDHVNPDEICPIIPSPSIDPRRGDALILEYMELLFDKFRVEPRNILYAAEKNPFEVYRQIYRTSIHYNDALKAVGGCRVVVSAVSSKLLSIGALLASYELKQGGYQIGISNVESHGYKMEIRDETADQEELFSLWLAGECYEQ